VTNYSTPPQPPAYGGGPEYQGGQLPPGFPVQQTSGWSIASLICGLLMCVPFVAGLLAVVFGILGIRRARDPQVGGKGLAIAGLILGLISIILWALFGAGVVALLKGTEAQRAVARQFVNDLAAGDAAAARSRCTAEVSDESIQAALEKFKEWGAVTDITLFGVEMSAATGSTTTTEVAGAVSFAGKAVTYTATLVRDGDSYRITSFKFDPR